MPSAALQLVEADHKIGQPFVVPAEVVEPVDYRQQALDGKDGKRKLGDNHRRAITNREMVFRDRAKLVHSAGTYDSRQSLIKEAENDKIGRWITKGRWRGLRIHTFTLEERATCPVTCSHYRTCYGNSMRYAFRFKADEFLLNRLRADLKRLQAKYPKGFVVRLHVLGDFYSIEYVLFWRWALATFPALKIYGYTHRWPGQADGIGDAIRLLRALAGDRFLIRFSDYPDEEFSALAQSIAPMSRAVVCPFQTGRVANCAACGICWESPLTVVFLDHDDHEKLVARWKDMSNKEILEALYGREQIAITRKAEAA